MQAFTKMHGLGNDFVVLDARTAALDLSVEKVQSITDRRFGIGCDQLVLLEPSAGADVFMRLYNADGSTTRACGNATRCVAWLVGQEKNLSSVRVETEAGILSCALLDGALVQVNMGKPELSWQQIPLSQACDTNHLPIEGDPSAVSMGNPHMVFAIADVDTIPLELLGPALENHPLFPERVNVSFAQIISPERVRLRVWERGAGATLACGTAACATVVALNRRGLLQPRATVELPGGELVIEWQQGTAHVLMTGAVAKVFMGEIAL